MILVLVSNNYVQYITRYEPICSYRYGQSPILMLPYCFSYMTGANWKISCIDSHCHRDWIFWQFFCTLNVCWYTISVLIHSHYFSLITYSSSSWLLHQWALLHCMQLYNSLPCQRGFQLAYIDNFIQYAHGTCLLPGSSFPSAKYTSLGDITS